MAFRYHVNLAAERVEKHRARCFLLRAVTISLFVLLLMLGATYVIYLFRGHQIVRDEGETRLLAAKISRAGISPDEVASLQQENQELAAMLESISRLVRSSAPWSAILLDLEECCRAGTSKIRKVQAKELERGQIILHVEALSEGENPVTDVYDFLRAAAKQDRFEVGSLLSIEQERDETTFHIEIPLSGSGAEAGHEPAETET